MADRICLSVDKRDSEIQISIGIEREDGSGHGYRIAGPKYGGMSKALKKHTLTPRDAEEIYGYIKPLLVKQEAA
jgi:hypothetical protein